MGNEEENKEEARTMSKIKEEIGKPSDRHEGKTEVCFHGQILLQDHLKL